jgi:hypothetical protein
MTYATHGGKDDRFCRAVESAVQHKVPLRILGWGEKWRGLTQKFEGALETLKTLPDSCTVVFTDAYDVLYTSDLESIKREHEAMGAPVLFAGECGCWPQITRDRGKGDVCLNEYPTAPTPYRFLNSGQWIMHASNAKEIFQALIDVAPEYAAKFNVPVSKINDQEMASDFYMQGRHNIQLDHTNRIFQAMHATHAAPLKECDPWPEMQVIDGRWENKAFQTAPKILHFNGGGKIHHLNMEAAMWYKQPGRGGMTKAELGATVLIVGDGGGRKASLKEMCPTYF